MPLNLATGIVTVKIDRQQLRAEIKAVRAEIIKGLSGIRVKVQFDHQHFQRQAASAGRAAGRAAGAAASQGFREGMRTGATGMVPSGGMGMTARRGMAPYGGGWYETSPGTFLAGAPLRGLHGPAGRTFNMGGAGQARLGTTFGGRTQRGIGGSPFQPAGFLGYGRRSRFGTLPSATPNPFINQMSGGAWANYLGQLGQGPAVGGRGGGRGGNGRFGGVGGRGFFGSGPAGRFAGGAAFQMNPLLALSAHYGGVAGGAGALTAMAGVEGVKAFAEFEEAIHWVRILQREAGATEAAMARLENQARQFGLTTVFSAAEAANAMAVLTKRGFSAGQVEQQMPNVLNLAAAGDIGIDEAADIISSTQKQFQLGAGDTRNIADLLAKASLESASDVRTLGVALSYVGPVAKNAGMDLQETLAVITALEDAGIKGSRAGTGLARVIAKLANKDTEEAFRAIGVEVRELNGNFRSTEDIVEDLQTALRNLPAPDKFAFFNSLFRERGGLAFTAVVNQGADAIERMNAKLDQSGGTSARIAAERMKILTAQVKNLADAAKELGIAFGTEVEPAISGVVQLLTESLKGWALLIKDSGEARGRLQDWARGLVNGADGNVPPPGVGRPRAAPPPDAARGPIQTDRVFPGIFGFGEMAPDSPRGFTGLGAAQNPFISRSRISGGMRGFGAGMNRSRVQRQQRDVGAGFGGLGVGAGGGGIVGRPTGGITGGLGDFGRDMAAALREKNAVPPSNFRPEIMGIEEFQRSTQLGVMGKANDPLVDAAEGTEQNTGELLSFMRDKFQNGGAATFS